MRQKRALERARQDQREGKKPSTQAGEFVKEEVERAKKQHKRSVKSRKQAVAIGLSKARHAGIALPPPKQKKKNTSAKRTSKRGSTRRKTLRS